MNSILIDTNVLVYAKDASSIYHAWSSEIIKHNYCYVTSKNLSEYYVVVTRGIDPVLNSKEALQDLIEFMSSFNVVYPDKGSYEKVMELSLQYGPRGLRFHDFEIAAVALVNGITKIATVNVGDFKAIREVEIIHPESIPGETR